MTGLLEWNRKAARVTPRSGVNLLIAEGGKHDGDSIDTSLIWARANTVGASGKAAPEGERDFIGSSRGAFLQPGSGLGGSALPDVVWWTGLGRTLIALLEPVAGQILHSP